VTAEDNGIICRQRTFVAPHRGERPPGPSPWWHPHPVFVAEFDLGNGGDEAAQTQLRLNFATDKNLFESASVGGDETNVPLSSDGRVLAVVHSDNPQAVRARTEDSAIILSASLPAHATARARVYIPGWDVKVGDEATVCAGAPSIDTVEGYWLSLLGPSMQVDIPDRLLSDVIRASQVYCFMNARNEGEGARIAPWIGADRYGPLESEGHSIVAGMDLFGHHDFARRALEFYIKRYNAQGYLTTGYTMMGTGQHLWALGEHFGLTHDTEWLRAKAPEVARVAEWIADQRRKTEVLDAFGNQPPEYGLVPPGVIADWHRYAYRYYMEGYYCAGLRAAARALDAIGHEGAEALAAESERFLAAVQRAYDWTQARTPAPALSDGSFIPGVPSMVYTFGTCEEQFPGEDWGRSWAGDADTGTHHLAALGLLDAESAEVERMAQILEDYWFLRAGLGDYPEEKNHADWFNLGGFSKIQPYYCRLNHVYALRDDVKPFIRSYFNAIPTLLNTENRSLWEHFHNRGGWNKTHETGWLLEQTRNMFVTERGEELWLAPFVTTHWMQDGMTVAISNAPSRFGPLNYEIRSRVAEGVIDAGIKPPTRSTPKAIVLRLRHPEGKPMRAVTVNGKPHTDFDAERECIILQPTTEPIMVRAEY